MIRVLLFFVLLSFSCKKQFFENKVSVNTMGTTGSIKYISLEKKSYQKQIDSLLLAVNMSMSTYIDLSTISKFNNKNIDLKEALKDEMFATNYQTSKNIWTKTKHTFNPAILPLVNFWKVQNKEKNSFHLKIDTLKIDSLVQEINATSLFTEKHDMPLDFSAIAKGYGVDVVAYFLEKKGIENYMVEIGGEVHCKGKNLQNNYWKIGIEEPNEKDRKLFEVIEIKNKSMATSGNYRNFKILDSGQKIVHIINPKTGYPEISNLLSASIISDECMIADGYATACMVMGLDTCFDFVLSQNNLECFLIYSDKNGDLKTKVSPGFNKTISKDEK